MENMIELVLPTIIHVLESMGIIIVFIGSIKSFLLYFISLCTKKEYPVKRDLAFALALGLEYKMGAEILKTVLIRDMQEIRILGAIIILRALLSFLIHFEMNGEHESTDSTS